MKNFIRNIDFLFPLLIGFLLAWQYFEKKQYDQICIILFIASTFAATRWRFTQGSKKYQEECEEILKKRREDAKRSHWYDGFGVTWGSTITAATLVSVIIFVLSYFLYQRFLAHDYLVSFFIAGAVTCALRVMRYFARYFFLDVLCGVIIVAVFVVFSQIN